MAKTAGFCSGVKIAVDKAYKAAREKPGRVCTYGPIIHNAIVVSELRQAGIDPIESLDEARGRKVLIRSHGVAPEVYAELSERGLEYIDCTCRDVKKIQNIAQEAYKAGRRVIIAGKGDHPEIIGVNGHCGHTAVIVKNADELRTRDFSKSAKYTLVAQTTFSQGDYLEIQQALAALGLDLDVCDTICRATQIRQREAAELAEWADVCVVLGDKSSSNSLKLVECCKKSCSNVHFIESFIQLNKEFRLQVDYNSVKIGVTAGASTSPATIKEAVRLMNDDVNTNEEQKVVNEQQSGSQANSPVSEPASSADDTAEKTFEEMVENIVSLHTGKVVKGTVISVANGEVTVNLGYKSDGVIPKGEFSEDPDVNPEETVKPGDVLDVFVVRVNDQEGNVTLSKKKVDANKNLDELEKAVESKAVVKGKIIEIIKGGAIAVITGLRAFVPMSQISNRFVSDIEAYKGKELEFNILEFDRGKRKIVAGRKELVAKRIAEAREKAFDTLQPGQIVEGTVSRLTEYGAFVDLGGVDGLVHVSEISWARIRRPADALKTGEKIQAYIIDVNREKGKISLSIKQAVGDPWAGAEERYARGTIHEGTVVRMTGFGAFVALEHGIDGLLHISQIAEERIQKPEDVLSIGDKITVEVTDFNAESRRVSLSKKLYERRIGYADEEGYEQDGNPDEFFNRDQKSDDYFDDGEAYEEASFEQGDEPEEK